MFNLGDASSCGPDKAFVGTVWSSVASNGLGLHRDLFRKSEGRELFRPLPRRLLSQLPWRHRVGWGWAGCNALLVWETEFLDALAHYLLWPLSWTAMDETYFQQARHVSCVTVSNLGRVKDWTFSDGWGTSSQAFLQAHWACLWHATLFPLCLLVGHSQSYLQINISNLRGFHAASKQCIRLR